MKPHIINLIQEDVEEDAHITDTPHTPFSPHGWEIFDANSPAQTGFYTSTTNVQYSPNVENFTTQGDKFLFSPEIEKKDEFLDMLDITSLPVVLGDLASEETVDLCPPKETVLGINTIQLHKPIGYTPKNTNKICVDPHKTESLNKKMVGIIPNEDNNNDTLISEYVINNTNGGILEKPLVKRCGAGLALTVAPATTPWYDDLISTPDVLSCVEQLETENYILPRVVTPDLWQENTSLESEKNSLTTLSPTVDYEPITPKSESQADSDEDYKPTSTKKRRRESEDSDYAPQVEKVPRKYKRKKSNIPLKEMILALEDSQQLPKVRRGRPPKRRESTVSSVGSIDDNASTASTHEMKYRELRDKNNEASKRSRMTRNLKNYDDIVGVLLPNASKTAAMITSHPAILNSTMVLEYDDYPLLMPRWGYVASAFTLFLIGFFGFFLNLMVILLMIKDRQLWTPLNIILFNLVCSDFSVSVVGNPLTLISALNHRWVFGRTMCMLYGFFMALLGITSITTLTVISFERYLMVTRPLSRRHLSSRGALGSVFFIWIYSLALTTPPLYGWGKYVNEAANISCSVNWHEQSQNALTYILFLFAMGQIVPFIVITFSYVNIIRTMKRNSQRLGRVSRAEARATTMVLIMIIAFTIAWTPYSVFALMEQFATDRIISPGAGVIPALVAKSSICYDPLIYVGMNNQFRQAIKRVFGIHGKRDSPDRKYNHTITSPAHHLTSFNDISTKFNSEYNSNKNRNKNYSVTDESSEITNNEINRPCCARKLCTIQEAKTGSDAERSGETLYEDDSSSSRKHGQSEGKTCQYYDETQSEVNVLVIPSPRLTVLDPERILFTKVPKETNVEDLLSNYYGNKGFENDGTDVIDSGGRVQLKHSCTFGGGPMTEQQRRRLSMDSVEYVHAKNLFDDRKVVAQFYDQNSKENTNYHSYIFGADGNNDGEENL